MSLARASPLAVEALIRPLGFFRTMARTIIGGSRALVERHGGEVPSTMEELLRLPGIGRKGANAILGVGFGIPGFPVDTQVRRVTNRLELASSPDPAIVERQVCAVVMPADWTALSLRLILHGRQIWPCPAASMRGVCPDRFLPQFEHPGLACRGAATARPLAFGQPRIWRLDQHGMTRLRQHLGLSRICGKASSYVPSGDTGCFGHSQRCLLCLRPGDDQHAALAAVRVRFIHCPRADAPESCRAPSLPPDFGLR